MRRGGGWGLQSYAQVADQGGGWRKRAGSGRGGQGTRNVPGPETAGIMAVNRQVVVAEREAQDLKNQALKKKAYLQLKWDLDCNRKHLGKGNIVNILINDQNQRVVNVEKKNINTMLRVSGFSIEDVMGITINEYRPNQVEVMFEDDVLVDTVEMENKINSNGFDVTVAKFDRAEDHLIIYGLPLTNNVKYMEDQIREAVGPFVKEVTEVKPLVHSDEVGDDFFKGKRNGNWRVKTVPMMGRQIPNYIVVGIKERVMGKVVYSRNAGEKKEMCADCFSTEHFKRAPECSGPVKWSVYCEQFRMEWNRNYVEQETEDDGSSSVTRDSRIDELQKNLQDALADAENKEKELEEKLLYSEGVQQELEDLKKKVAETNDLNVAMKEDLKSLEIKVRRNGELEEQVKILKKRNKELEMKNQDDQVLMETAFRRMSANVTFRDRSRSVGSIDKSKQLDISSWKIPPGPHLPTRDMSFPTQTSLVDTQELASIDVMEEENEVFLCNAVGISPPCYGFGEEENEPEVRIKLGEKIKKKEKSIDGVIVENMEESQNLIVPGTPKRTRTGEQKPQRLVRRKSDPKALGKHPELGKEIDLETYGGKKKYFVCSKKNRKKEDFSYTLTNEEGDQATFDLKDQRWEYSEVEEDPLNARNNESSQ